MTFILVSPESIKVSQFNHDITCKGTSKQMFGIIASNQFFEYYRLQLLIRF